MTVMIDGIPTELEAVACTWRTPVGTTCNCKVWPPSALQQHLRCHRAREVAFNPGRFGRGGKPRGPEKPGRRMSATGVEHKENIRAA